ncbi:MAG: hypothetical protein Q9221_003994 [Calogaya cf. arnoldii]
MTETTHHYRTLNGQPPNGGVPPGVGFYPAHPPAAPPATPAASPPPPPYALHYFSPNLDPRMFLPQQIAQPQPPPPPPSAPPIHALVDPRWFYPPLQMILAPPAPAPAPAPPAPAPAPAPAPQQWMTTPPGASLFGQPAPTFGGGVDYLFPQDHTVIHFIHDVHMRLDTPIPTPGFEARLFPTNLPVVELIRRLGAPTTDDSKFGVMEVHQLGDGKWTAGMTVLLNSDAAKKTLREIGWGTNRGSTAPAVWIKAHAVG